MDEYHRKYASLPNVEVQKRVEEKKQELLVIFSVVPFDKTSELIQLAVMGCGDKRFIKAHERIFSEVLGKSVEVTTFDIKTEHLLEEKRVIKHDCTLPLPGGPYSITYAHVLLKFVETEKQWNVIRNSYDALGPGGMAIHVLDKEDYETKSQKLRNGQYSVPLDRWREMLEKEEIKHKIVPVKYGQALILIR
jgi:hypothetical protein